MLMRRAPGQGVRVGAATPLLLGSLTNTAGEDDDKESRKRLVAIIEPLFCMIHGRWQPSEGFGSTGRRSDPVLRAFACPPDPAAALLSNAEMCGGSSDVDFLLECSF